MVLKGLVHTQEILSDVSWGQSPSLHVAAWEMRECGSAELWISAELHKRAENSCRRVSGSESLTVTFLWKILREAGVCLEAGAYCRFASRAGTNMEQRAKPRAASLPRAPCVSSSAFHMSSHSLPHPSVSWRWQRGHSRCKCGESI